MADVADLTFHRRMKVAALLLQGADVAHAATRLELDESTVRADAAALQAAVAGEPFPNLAAAERTIAALAQGGRRKEDADAALVEAVRTLARRVDVDPDNAALWRQYRYALVDLLNDDDDDGTVAGLLAELSGTTVGDAPPS